MFDCHGPPSSLQDQVFTFCNLSNSPLIFAPSPMRRACFPGVEPPMDLQLRLEVDGHPWGEPFESRINGSFTMITGLRSFPELSGCRVIGLRHEARPDGPAAVTALLSSLGDERHGVAVGPGPDEWPVVSSLLTELGRACEGRAKWQVERPSDCSARPPAFARLVDQS
jgi:hypothetical protein